MLKCFVLAALVFASSANAAEIVIRWEGTVTSGTNPKGFFGSSVQDLTGRRFAATFVIETTAGQFIPRGSEEVLQHGFGLLSERRSNGQYSNPVKSSSLTINGFTHNFVGANSSAYNRNAATALSRSLISTKAFDQVAPPGAKPELFPEYFFTTNDFLDIWESPTLTEPAIAYGGVMESFTRKPTRAAGFFQRLDGAGELIFAGRLAPDSLSVTASTEPSGFVPVAPCRAFDTRQTNAPIGVLVTVPFEGTVIAPRSFSLRGICGLPADATAYSLNVTVVPRGPLGFLTAYPSGQPRPLTSTLNSLDGRIKANAVILPAGPDGSINLFATEPTDVIIDVNGAFVPERTNPLAQAFYTVSPCRIVPSAAPGGRIPLSTNTSRPVSIANTSGCGVPSNASAYVLNATAVPKGRLGFVTLWPDNGSPRPTVSTLNALTGTVTANMAIVPSGPAGSVQAYASDDTDLILDVTGYFAPAGGLNALSFFTLAPCRSLDTRLATGPLGGPILSALSTRSLPLQSGSCSIPSQSRAYSLNATVVPPAALGFLTLFPTGVNLPVVSTLNAVDGSITSNAAIVPADASPRGDVSAYVTERTHLLLDINGYFAPRNR